MQWPHFLAHLVHLSLHIRTLVHITVKNRILKIYCLVRKLCTVTNCVDSNPAGGGDAAISCNNNETIGIGVSRVTSTTTTYLPPTGVPGDTGPTGDRVCLDLSLSFIY